MARSTFSPIYQLLLRKLIFARKSAGISQQALAEILGKPQSFVSKYESAERRIDAAELIEIGMALGTPASQLVAEVESGLMLPSDQPTEGDGQ